MQDQFSLALLRHNSEIGPGDSHMMSEEALSNSAWQGWRDVANCMRSLGVVGNCSLIRDALKLQSVLTQWTLKGFENGQTSHAHATIVQETKDKLNHILMVLSKLRKDDSLSNGVPVQVIQVQLINCM